MTHAFEPRPCQFCGQSFQPTVSNQKFCRLGCPTYDRTVYPVRRPCVREGCRETVEILSSRHKAKRYCSKACATAAYKLSKGLDPSPRRNIAVERPFTLSHGLAVRPDACPKCGNRYLTQEPAFTRCRLCGGDWPIAGVGLGEQMLYEAALGLGAPRGGSRWALPAERGTQGDAHVG